MIQAARYGNANIPEGNRLIDSDAAVNPLLTFTNQAIYLQKKLKASLEERNKLLKPISLQKIKKELS